MTDIPVPEPVPELMSNGQPRPTKITEIVATVEDQRAGPDRILELANEAAAKGLPFRMAQAESHSQRRVREWGEDKAAPTISASDHRAFLRNLQKIAAGDLRVI